MTDIVSVIRDGSEPEQGLKPRSELTARELLREVGAVLRMSEADAAKLGDLPADPDEDQTMVINMGPQHPSTHGVLRLMLELKGEEVLRSKPIIGYLHTGMEKTSEQLTFMQGGTNVTRMDYVSPLNNELVFSLATEKLLGIEDDIPPRATWMRMLLSELNRMSSHLLFLATNGMDIGAVGMMIYGWREREEVLRVFQKVTTRSAVDGISRAKLTRAPSMSAGEATRFGPSRSRISARTVAHSSPITLLTIRIGS